MDLVILATDRNIQNALQSLFARFPLQDQAGNRIDIRYVIGRDDPFTFRHAADLLRPCSRKAQYALAVLDFQWSHSFETSAQIRDRLRDRLEKNGWPGRCEVIVIDPMLEIWA